MSTFSNFYITFKFFTISINYSTCWDNYIFNNIVYDLGNVYDFGGVQSMFDELMRNQSTNVASTLEGKKSAIESAIEECLMAYGVK